MRGKLLIDKDVSFMHKTKPHIKRYASELRKSGTDAEHWLWRYLRNRRMNGYKFRRQVPIGNYIVDFLCKEKGLVIELDGSQHCLQKEYDQERTEYLISQGYMIVRYWNNQVLQEGEAVLEDIFLQLENHR